MNASNRRIQIFSKLVEDKKVLVNDLAKQFDVTTMTIRRDLMLFEKQGIVSLIYGGAILNEGAASEPSFQLKNSQSLNAKISIAYYASKLIQDGDSIFIDCGSTTLQLGQYLSNKNITVLTNSCVLIDELKKYPKLEIIICPGIYDRTSEGAISSTTIDFLNNHHVNKSFIACQGFNIDKGPSNPNELENRVKSSAIDIADEAYLLLDHTKFGVNCTHYLNGTERFKKIITDEAIDSKTLRKLQEKYPIETVQIITKQH